MSFLTEKFCNLRTSSVHFNDIFLQSKLFYFSRKSRKSFQEKLNTASMFAHFLARKIKKQSNCHHFFHNPGSEIGLKFYTAKNIVQAKKETKKELWLIGFVLFFLSQKFMVNINNFNACFFFVGFWIFLSLLSRIRSKKSE
jgi:hypothetical protein